MVHTLPREDLDRETVEPARLEIEREGREIRLVLTGTWRVAFIREVDAALRAFRAPRDTRVSLELSGIESIDTAGAWLVHRTYKAVRAGGATAELSGVNEGQRRLIASVALNDRPMPMEVPPLFLPLELLIRIGRATSAFFEAAVSIAGFFGLSLVVAGRAIVDLRRLRLVPFVYHVEQVGLNAVPIIALINFLVGAVIAYQGATQLRLFGAEVFTVDLTAISVLREIGILLTAIMVAGRSGSAFAAEIGAMKVHEEIDAMRTLALDPMEMLVLPRMLALIVALPLLAFLADIAGLAGGATVSWITLDITPPMFLERLAEVTDIKNFWVGIFKAPFFGFLIALIGCYEGFRVEGSAESVGQHTTLAVVEAIFVVIIADALFSIFFVQIGW
jgi:phospholipid/cholesterol/gamma-HCH transport system permease protein